jgi:hypothetical protein
MPGWPERITWPTKYEIVGSNSKTCGLESDWEILVKDDSGREFKSLDEVRREIIPAEKENRRQCYGIRVTEVSRTNGKKTTISRIRMWYIKE